MKPACLRLLSTAVVSIAFLWTPAPVFAQRGHMGGGGFHGGVGHSAYAGGGRFYGGYHGGGYYGWRGGSGWHGWGYPRYGWGYPGYGWGYPRYGWGWGFGIGVGFSWGPYWPAYPYWYGYSPWWGVPYSYPYYPYYAPPAYPYSCPCPCNNSGDCRDNSTSKPSSTPTEENSPAGNSVMNNVVASTPTASNYRASVATNTAANYWLTSSTDLPVRREVQNAIRALRAMPPDARQRQIESGRYSNFSADELDLLKSASRSQLAWGTPQRGVPRPQFQ